MRRARYLLAKPRLYLAVLYGGVLLGTTRVFAAIVPCTTACQLDKPSILGIPQLTVTNVFQDVITVFSFVAGVLSAIFLIIGGIRYSTSTGDSHRVESAKQTLLYAVLGLIVSILAPVITDFIVSRSP